MNTLLETSSPALFKGFFDESTRHAMRRHRMALGLSYSALGRFLGVHWSTIRKWENGLIRQCTLQLRTRVASFLRGDYDFDIHANLGDPRLGAYLRSASSPATACVQRFASCYQLLGSRPDLRSLLVEEAFRATREALTRINAEWRDGKDANFSQNAVFAGKK